MLTWKNLKNLSSCKRVITQDIGRFAAAWVNPSVCFLAIEWLGLCSTVCLHLLRQNRSISKFFLYSWRVNEETLHDIQLIRNHAIWTQVVAPVSHAMAAHPKGVGRLISLDQWHTPINISHQTSRTSHLHYPFHPTWGVHQWNITAPLLHAVIAQVGA